MKKLLLFLSFGMVNFIGNAQSITLSPTASYPITVKSNTSAFGYGELSTKSTTGSLNFYYSATNANLGTQAGNILAGANGLTLFGFSNATLFAGVDAIIGAGFVERMYVKANGNVGIGYSTPNNKLEVYQTGNASGGWGAYVRNSRIATASNGTHVTANDNYDAIGVAAFGANASYAGNKRNIGVLGTTDVGGWDNIGIYGYQKGAFEGVANPFGVRGEVEQTGAASAYGVFATAYGTGSGTKYGLYASATGTGTKYAGYFSGNVYIAGDFYYTGNFSATSDEKLKTNLKIMDSALEKVMALNPSTYEYKTEDYKGMNLAKGNHFGFTAQGVQKVFPELVSEKTISNATPENKTDQTSTTYLSVNYIEIIPILTKAIQEQQVVIKELQAEILKLKNK